MANQLQILSPIDGKVFYTGEYLSEAQAFSKLKSAETVRSVARAATVAQRVEWCLRFLDSFEVNREANARQVTAAMGKPLCQALAEVKGMRARTEALCLAAPLVLSDQILPELVGSERFVRREPLGVVLNIAAWNYPYVVAVNVVIPAVLAGNAVLLKHSPQTAIVGQQFERAFQNSGAPAHLVQDFMVDHPLAAQVLRSHRIHHVGFTGSVRGGHEVYSLVAQSGFASCGLELGGKDAAIVLEDADVESTAKSLVEGAFYNAGQSCCAVERIYVPDRLHDSFVDAFVEQTHQLKMGDPFHSATDMGPVVSEHAARRVTRQVSEALSLGAKQVSRDDRFQVPETSDCYLPPRVLVDVDSTMSLMKDETFGPAIGIERYRDERHAIELVNASNYGLTASIWTQEEQRARQLGDCLQVGTVYMNRCDAVDPNLPWVGTKDSGLGHTLSPSGIRNMTRPKSFNFRI